MELWHKLVLVYLDFSDYSYYSQFSNAFKNAFSTHPVYSKFGEDEIGKIYDNIISKNYGGKVIIDSMRSEILAFGVGFRTNSLIDFPNLTNDDVLLDYVGDFYLDKFGSVSKFQGQGFGRMIANALLLEHEKVILRTRNPYVVSTFVSFSDAKHLFKEGEVDWYCFEK